MRFRDPCIQDEYDRLIGKIGEISALSPPLIGMHDALAAYFALADYFTDPANGEVEDMLVGLRSADLLGSALGRQVVSYGGEVKYCAPLDIIATLFFGMVKNHPFSDGNKRTALLLLLLGLYRFGYRPIGLGEEFEALVLAVAAGTLATAYPCAWQASPEDDREVHTIAACLSRLCERAVAHDGEDELFAVIRRFEAPLRRLKDE
jgi:death-on-curing protein